jgi:hypothetical protein
VANAAMNERRGAARFGRLASRVLFVLGGTVAGTAAAWAVSSASASADVAPVISTPGTSVTPVTDATTAGLSDATHGASTFAGDVTGAGAGAMCDSGARPQEITAWSVPAEDSASARPVCGGPATDDDTRAEGHEVSGRVSDAVTDFADNAVVSPAKRTLGSLEHIARKPEDTRQVLDETIAGSPEAQDVGRKVWELLDPSGHGDLVPELPIGVPFDPESPLDSVGADEHATDFAQAATALFPTSFESVLALPGAAHSGVAGHGTDDDPSRDGQRDADFPLSPAQLPAVPSIPTVPGGGTAPGGHLDGPTYGVPAWVAPAVDSAMAGITRAGVRHMPLTPGSQPGVTPD